MSGKYSVLVYVQGTLYKMYLFSSSYQKEGFEDIITNNYGKKEDDWYRMDDATGVTVLDEIIKDVGVVCNLVPEPKK